MFGGKKVSFDGGKLFQHMQNAQHGLSEGWKNIADKAKKEAKIVNKKARKVLATEDGGKLRDDYILTVNLDAGHDLFKQFQNNWVTLHSDSVKNVKKAADVDQKINEFTKECHKCNTYIEEFYGNLLVLPDVIALTEMAQKRIETIGEQTANIEKLLVAYEDSIERCSFERKKIELKVKLSQLVETKHAEYNIKKSMLAASKQQDEPNTILVDQSVMRLEKPTTTATPTPPAEVPQGKHGKELDRQKSVEKQKAYEDAFLDQMNRYIQYGELDQPISGHVSNDGQSIEDDIQIDDDDLTTLKEFLGPEELNSIIQASHKKDIKPTADISTVVASVADPAVNLTVIPIDETSASTGETLTAGLTINNKNDEINIVDDTDINSTVGENSSTESQSETLLNDDLCNTTEEQSETSEIPVETSDDEIFHDTAEIADVTLPKDVEVSEKLPDDAILDKS